MGAFANQPLPSVDELVEYRLNAQHVLTRKWIDDEARRELLRPECADDLRLATDQEIAVARAGRFAPSQPAHVMLNRWHDVGAGLSAMLSMRYQGLDVSLPFVDASLVSRPIQTSDLPGLRSAALETYGVLSPLYLRLWDARPDGAIPGTFSDRRFLAAPLSELRARPRPPRHLRLQATERTTHYDELQAAYAMVDAEHPAHPRQASVQPREDMEEAASAGTLFDVLVGEEWSGYVGALPYGDTLGMPAWVVLELVLTRSARGLGYGHYLSEMSARELSDDRSILIGTIHAGNRGARTAALKAHRHDVGGWVVVPLSADAGT